MKLPSGTQVELKWLALHFEQESSTTAKLSLQFKQVNLSMVFSVESFLTTATFKDDLHMKVVILHL